MTESTSLVPVRDAQALALAGPMTDDEIQRTYRTAQALAASGIYKDVRSAEQGFAKLLMGRALGLNEQQALSLYVMEGKIEVPYNLLGNMVRSRPGYDFHPMWIVANEDGTREAVLLKDEDPTDMREVVGAAIEFTVDGEKRGVSRWMVEDSERAELNKPRGQGGKKSNHVLYPRNMFLARSMSNGVKWIVPEVSSGIPVYSPGEIERVPNLADGEGDGSEPGWQGLSIQLAAEVEKVIRKAAKVGHSGIADRATAQMTLNGQTEEFVRGWIERQSAELARMQSPEPEPEEVDGEPVGLSDAVQAEVDSVDGTEREAELESVRERLELARADGNAEEAADLEAQLDALEGEDPGQGSLL